MERITAVVDLETNTFCAFGHDPDDRHVVIEVPYNPNSETERYTGDPANPIRPATAQEKIPAAAAKAVPVFVEAIIAGVIVGITGTAPTAAQLAAAVAGARDRLSVGAIDAPAVSIVGDIAKAIGRQP